MHSLLWTSPQVPRIFAHMRILKNGLSTPSSRRRSFASQQNI
jgi:hypothetical protein